MKLNLICLALLITSCNVDSSQKDIVLGTTGIENTWNKAVQDTRNEFDGVYSDSKETLYTANIDVVNEEHLFNAKAKAAGSKANFDVLDTAAKANADTLDTAAKANTDTVAEEHKFNDTFKTTTKKANMDVVAEGDKLTDRVVGSDDKTVDDHGDRIAELEQRVKLNTALLTLQGHRIDDLQERTFSLETASDDIRSALTSGLKYSQDQLDALLLKVSNLSVEDIAGFSEQFEAVYAAIELVELTPGPQGSQGPQGDTGVAGPRGRRGHTGAQGEQGVAGIDGTNGADGTNGQDGETGTNGTNGVDGLNGPQGTPGTNGTNGTNGTSCSVTSVNFTKENCTNDNNSSVKSALKTITCGTTSTSFCVKN